MTANDELLSHVYALSRNVEGLDTRYYSLLVPSKHDVGSWRVASPIVRGDIIHPLADTPIINPANKVSYTHLLSLTAF